MADTITSTIRQRQAYDYQTIRGLASGYEELHLFSLTSDHYIPYFVEKDGADSHGSIMAMYLDFYSALEAFALDYCHPDDQHTLIAMASRDAIAKALFSKKKYTVKFRARGLAGDYRWYQYVFIKFEDVHEEPSEIAAGFVDIDEAVKAKEVTEERYNFLINVAHEIRTPLTLISGPLRMLLRRGDLSEKALTTIGRACAQADRITNLLNTVLTTDRIEHGACNPTPETIDFNGWATSLTEEYKEEAEHKGISLKLVTAPTVKSVRFDDNLCRIVFYNIVTNAMQHIQHGSTITVSTGWNDAHNAVRLSVRDMGSGIGDIDPDLLFKRYYRATEESTGFGIGLAYSKTIIDAHHGRIGAYNNIDGPGATFWFELPA